MRLQQLLEYKNETITEERAWELIETDAQPFLKAVGYNVPLRGTKGPDIFVGQYRENRKSSAGMNSFQTYVDEWLWDHGARALRSNSIFLTNTPDVTEQYGEPYMIFPLGEFRYHWYKNSPDLIQDTNNIDFKDNEYLDMNSIVKKVMKKADAQIDTEIDVWSDTTHYELVINSTKGYLAIKGDVFMRDFYDKFDEMYDLPIQMSRKKSWLT